MRPSPPPGRPLAAILCILACHWAISTLDASGKWVMSTGVSLLFLCWVRYSVHLVLVSTLVVPGRGWRVLRSHNIKAQIARGASMLLATGMFFTTLSYLPLAEATSINFLAPLIVLALSPWLLGEPRYRSRWLAALVAFGGMLIVVRPGSGLDPLGVVFGLLTALCFTLQYITTRRVASDDPLTTLVWSGAVGTIVLTLALPAILPPMLDTLVELTALQWLVLCSTGVSGALGHLFQINAFRMAPASLLAPFMYAQIIAASTIGWLVWGYFSDTTTWAGIGVICASGIIIAIVEWHRTRGQRSPAIVGSPASPRS